ncbi:SPRY domain containing protein [Acanthamoeba castellanii str. Neff]|uniref:SPRY domain containing protein n=1 Tax=Acanthamoeba castellanii (strain ATCC 30010 / Neff) TaxID=1257118 RepID=L8H2U8_ACACF|nr:SPRY domain containing protein [Acanthamoeba castellanii str. Neff]ELR19043.1 SPRY domain containing protein [Acanthamoeba castellanii str. Neff]
MDIVQIVIYNLRLRREDELLAEGKEVAKDKMFFRFKEDICYFIDKNWGRVCFGKSRTVTWNNTIGSSLSSHPELFVSGYNYYKQSGFWSTVSPNNPTIGAGGVSVDRSKRLKERKATDSTKERKPSSKKKRRPTEVNPWVDKRAKAKPKKKKNKIPKAAPPVFFAGPLFYEPDGKYRKMCMAKENSARQAKIGADLLTVENEKGYRMVRAAYGAHEGCWFFEVVINQHSGNTRLGWSTEKGDLQAPVGYDGFSFAYRDKEGTIFHQSRGRTHLEPYVPEASNSGTAAAGGAASPAKLNAGADSATVGPGDTSPRATAPVPGPEEPPKPGPPLRHTEIRFYKNGRSQGPVFVDMLPAGTYYPAASMYNSASVTFNFGPDFKYSPMDVGTFMPCTRLVQVFDELQEKRKAEAEAAAAIAATKAAEEAALTEAAAAQLKADEMDYSQAHAASSTPYAPAGQPASPYPSTTSSSSYTSPASTAMDVSQGQAAAPTTAPPVSQPPAPEALSGGNDATVSSAGLSTSSAAISLLLNPADDEPMDVDPFFKPSFDSGENRDRG